LLDHWHKQLTDVADRLEGRRQTEGVDEGAKGSDPTLQGETLGSVLESQDFGWVKTPRKVRICIITSSE